MPNSGSDPATDPASNPATDPGAKSWDIEKILSYVLGRHWDSFTHVSMIVYGCLNTFLPILKIFDSCTPPYHPIFGTSFRWIVVKNRQKIVKNRQKSPKSPISRKIAFWVRSLMDPQCPGMGFLADCQPFLGSLAHFWSFFAAHRCLWEAMRALHGGVRWRKLPEMAKMLKSPKSRKMTPNWPQMIWNDPQMTFNGTKWYQSILK